MEILALIIVLLFLLVFFGGIVWIIKKSDDEMMRYSRLYTRAHNDFMRSLAETSLMLEGFLDNMDKGDEEQ